MPTSAELREMDDQELTDNLAASQQALFNLRFQHVTGQLDNYTRLREVRKDIARLHTIMREREIEAAESGEPATGEAESGDANG
jgi:large subunit ribosomal protein L29